MSELEQQLSCPMCGQTRDEVGRLERELAEANKRGDDYLHQLALAKRELTEMTKQRDDARAVLRKYGAHAYGCPWYSPTEWNPEPPCTCGFSKAAGLDEGGR